MNIVLVATDSGGRNLVFATDTLRAFGLTDAIELAEKGLQIKSEFYPLAKKILKSP